MHNEGTILLPLPYLIIAFLALLGAFLLSALCVAFGHIKKKEIEKKLSRLSNSFFYLPIHSLLFKKFSFETLYFALINSQLIFQFIFIASGVLSFTLVEQTDFPPIKGILILFVLLYIFSDLLPRLIAYHKAESTIKWLTPLSSIYLILTLPLNALLLKMVPSLVHTLDLTYSLQAEGKQDLIEMIQDADIEQKLEDQDIELFESIVSFRNRVVREIMIPRVDVFALPKDISILEAAVKLEEQGYSRIPIYGETIDDIVGILMYKDLLIEFIKAKSSNSFAHLDEKIDRFIKPVIFTPETKRIAHLLQDFRLKKVHIAVVVDEYGGTEGIVTIEDVLEEIVGDITDEYDELESLYIQESDGSWLVDARMNVIDIEDALGIHLPQEGDYDSIGGFIYQKAGMIPEPGYSLFYEEYKYTVIESSDRAIDKIKIERCDEEL